MDYINLKPDNIKLMNKHYTKGRSAKISKIVIHHNAGNLTGEGIWNVWQTRQASAHYQVDSSGSVTMLVDPSDTAWHCGNWTGNCESIGIEHANNNMSAQTVSRETLESGAKLCGALCYAYGLGLPVWGANVLPHSHYKKTSCPGALAGSQNIEYMSRAQEYYNELKGGTVSAAAEPVHDIDTIARDVIAGKYGNGQHRRDVLGTLYNEVQKRVNQIIRGGGAPADPVHDIDAIARDVIAGKYGNGQHRRDVLGTLYNEVQKRVNEILKG